MYVNIYRKVRHYRLVSDNKFFPLFQTLILTLFLTLLLYLILGLLGWQKNALGHRTQVVEVGLRIVEWIGYQAPLPLYTSGISQKVLFAWFKLLKQTTWHNYYTSKTLETYTVLIVASKQLWCHKYFWYK